MDVFGGVAALLGLDEKSSTTTTTETKNAIPPPPPLRKVKPPKKVAPSVKLFHGKDSPLSDQEEVYFSKFNLKKVVTQSKSKLQIAQQIQHFFKALYLLERKKWQYILEHYFMMDLITKTPVKQAFLELDEWQKLFLPCIARTGGNNKYDHSNNKYDHKQDESKQRRQIMSITEEQSLFAVTINMYEVLFFHTLISSEKKGRMRDLLADTLAIISKTCGWSVEIRMLCSVLLLSFLKKIGNQTKYFKRGLEEPCWANLNEALDLYVEFFFYRPCITTGNPNIDRRSFPGLHLDMNGCPDAALAQQIVTTFHRDLKIQNINKRISGEKKIAKIEKLIAQQFSDDMEFLTQILVYFNHIKSIALTLFSVQDDKSEKQVIKQSQKQLEQETSKILRLAERRNKGFKTSDLKKALNSSVYKVLQYKQTASTYKIGEIAQNLYYGNKVQTVDWKDLGQMTTELSDLATEARKSLRKGLFKMKNSNFDGNSNDANDADGDKNKTVQLARILSKRKEEIQRYILVDVFYYSKDQLRVQFFVPHLKENSKVKLLLDHSKRMICVKFDLEDTEFQSKSSRRPSKPRRYVSRETKLGLLQKYVPMPKDVDLKRKPILKQQPNSVTVCFALLKR